MAQQMTSRVESVASWNEWALPGGRDEPKGWESHAHPAQGVPFGPARLSPPFDIEGRSLLMTPTQPWSGENFMVADFEFADMLSSTLAGGTSSR